MREHSPSGAVLDLHASLRYSEAELEFMPTHSQSCDMKSDDLLQQAKPTTGHNRWV
jgi:hypothetical protein